MYCYFFHKRVTVLRRSWLNFAHILHLSLCMHWNLHPLSIFYKGGGVGGGGAKLSCLKYMIKFGYWNIEIKLFINKIVPITYEIKGVFTNYIAVLEILFLIYHCICACTNNSCLNAHSCDCEASQDMEVDSETSIWKCLQCMLSNAYLTQLKFRFYAECHRCKCYEEDKRHAKESIRNWEGRVHWSLKFEHRWKKHYYDLQINYYFLYFCTSIL